MDQKTDSKSKLPQRARTTNGKIGPVDLPKTENG